MNEFQDRRRARKQIYFLLMFIALAIVAGRIATVISREGDTAFLSANDRSRWCTITSLVELRTYEIDKLIQYKNDKNRRPWATIDSVRHRGADGEFHRYSSKPPLFPTMVAGLYWCVYQITGMQISRQPIYMARIILALVNLPMLAAFFWCVIGCIERVGRGQWSRIAMAAATCFGTMMMSFTVALNNHLVAAASTAIVAYIYCSAVFGPPDPDEDEDDELADDEIQGQTLSWWKWMLAGLAAGFCAANELPALSMMVFWCLLVALLDRAAIISFLSGIAIVAVAFVASNYVAHGSLKPPYMHRGLGSEIEILKSDAPPTGEQINGSLTNASVEFDSSGPIQISKSAKADRWIAQTSDNRLFGITKQEDSSWQLSYWDDWYDYPGSYWRGDKRSGVDLGEESRLVYFANMTVGHYGLFSLTPIWLLVPFGLVAGLVLGPVGYRRMTAAVLIATVVCIVFYLMRPKIDRNYGGVSSCFRWMLWFAPLWLVTMTKVLDWCARYGWSRVLFVVLLACSSFSMAVSLPSPWVHPWIYRFWQFLGWIAP